VAPTAVLLLRRREDLRDRLSAFFASPLRLPRAALSAKKCAATESGQTYCAVRIAPKPPGAGGAFFFLLRLSSFSYRRSTRSV